MRRRVLIQETPRKTLELTPQIESDEPGEVETPDNTVNAKRARGPSGNQRVNDGCGAKRSSGCAMLLSQKTPPNIALGSLPH